MAQQFTQLAKKHALVIILVALAIATYTRYFFTTNPRFEVLQTTMQNLDIPLLFEKSPIIIEDRLVTPYAAIDTMFKYLYVRKKEWVINNNVFNPFARNTHRYIYIYASSPINVQLIHPNLYNNGRPSNVLSLSLQNHQSLIIPMFWYYSIKGNAFSIELDSIFSAVYSTVIK